MKMKLYSSKTSPFARKVRVSLLELGLEGLVEEVFTDWSANEPAFLAANPLGQIPALITDKGESLPGSDLIIEYLQTRGGTLTSLPRGSARWSKLKRLNLADGLAEAAVSILLESRRPVSEQSPAWISRKQAAITRSLDALEAEAGEFLAELPSLVEIGVGCALGYLDFRFGTLDWRSTRPALAAWYAVFAERPSMVNTAPVA
ncbi:MAG: glutathione S-transferase family protein [Pseudomonadota bacterium]